MGHQRSCRTAARNAARESGGRAALHRGTGETARLRYPRRSRSAGESLSKRPATCAFSRGALGMPVVARPGKRGQEGRGKRTESFGQSGTGGAAPGVSPLPVVGAPVAASRGTLQDAVGSVSRQYRLRSESGARASGGRARQGSNGDGGCLDRESAFGGRSAH